MSPTVKERPTKERAGVTESEAVPATDSPEHRSANRAQRRQAAKTVTDTVKCRAARAPGNSTKMRALKPREAKAREVESSEAKSDKVKAVEVRAVNTKRRDAKASAEKPHDLKRHSANAKAREPWQIVFVPVERIEANPYQPRLSFDPLEMADLVASVREHGVQQPVIVRTCTENRCKSDVDASKSLNGKGQNGHAPHGYVASGDTPAKPQLMRYQLVTGERRLRACREAGRKVIPAIMRDDLSNQQVAELALLENIQRSNLTVIEEAKGYKRLMIEFRMKEERIAKKVGKSVQTIRDTLRLLQLPEGVQVLLSQKKLSAAHGHALLDLAPFESVCVSVAKQAATAPMTATALSAAPLPNAAELKKKGLLIELDYRTKFDWTNVCASCPHKAYVRSGHSSYCLKPLEWKSKQETAIELQKQEAARIMEEARQAGTNTVDVEQLSANSYRDLSHVQLPSGCSGSCPCRSEAAHPSDPTKRIAICLDPNRLSSLKEAERQAHQELRQRRAIALWNEAKGVLESDVGQGNLDKAAFLVALPILRGTRVSYGDDPEDWQQKMQRVGEELGLFPDWETLFDPETDEASEFAIWQELGTDQLLLLASCLLLLQEASRLVHYAGETPTLSFVLGHDRVSQLELQATELEESKLGEGEAGEEADELPQTELPDGDPPEDNSIDDGLPNGWPTEAELREGVSDDENDNGEGEGDDDENDEGNELYGIAGMGADEFNQAGFLHDEADLVVESHSFPKNGIVNGHNLNGHNADNHNGANSDEPYTVEAANADALQADAPQADATEANASHVATSGTEKFNIGVTPEDVQSVTAS